MSGRAGCRSHLLVLPSVVCATRVAADIAEALVGVTITHQHGCSQVGDDGVRTRDAFELIACNPNVAAALVVGLGCETVQGAALAARIAEHGQRVEFNGIQEQGGSAACVASGVIAGARLLEEAEAAARRPPALAETVFGIEASHASPLVAPLVQRALAECAAVVVGDSADAPAIGERRPAFGPVAGRTAILSCAGRGAQQHVALAAAGAHVIVAFPALDDAPVGFPVCPVIAVSGGSPLHAALGDDFDLRADATVEDLWALVLAVLAGTATAAEARGSRVFALERLAMSM